MWLLLVKQHTFILQWMQKNKGQRTDVYVFFDDPKPRVAVVSVSVEAAMRTIVEATIIDFGQIADTESSQPSGADHF